MRGTSIGIILSKWYTNSVCHLFFAYNVYCSHPKEAEQPFLRLQTFKDNCGKNGTGRWCEYNRWQWNKRSLRLIFRIIVASLMRDVHFEAIWGYIGNCLAKITCLSDFPLYLLKTHGIHVLGIECEFSSNCLSLIGPDSWFQLEQFSWLQLRNIYVHQG